MEKESSRKADIYPRLQSKSASQWVRGVLILVVIGVIFILYLRGFQPSGTPKTQIQAQQIPSRIFGTVVSVDSATKIITVQTDPQNEIERFRNVRISGIVNTTTQFFRETVVAIPEVKQEIRMKGIMIQPDSSPRITTGVRTVSASFKEVGIGQKVFIVPEHKSAEQNFKLFEVLLVMIEQ